MKTREEALKLRQLSNQELAVEYEKTCAELFQLQVSNRTNPDKSYASKRKSLKKNVARILTFWNERRTQA